MRLAESQKLGCRLRHLQARDRATVDPPWFGPWGASKSPPSDLTTPRLTTPPARAPPSHPDSVPLSALNLAYCRPSTYFPIGLCTFMRSMFTSSFSCSTVLRASAILAMLLDMAAAGKGLNAWQECGLGAGTLWIPRGVCEKGWCDPVTGEVVGTMSEWDSRDR